MDSYQGLNSAASHQVVTLVHVLGAAGDGLGWAAGGCKDQPGLRSCCQWEM